MRLSDQWHGSVKESTQGNQSLVCARGEEERGEEEGIGKQGNEGRGEEDEGREGGAEERGGGGREEEGRGEGRRDEGRKRVGLREGGEKGRGGGEEGVERTIRAHPLAPLLTNLSLSSSVLLTHFPHPLPISTPSHLP